LITARAFIAGLIIVGIVASLYSAPKSVLVSLIFAGSPTPFTDEWYGTSELANLLKNEGYEFIVLFSTSDIQKVLRESPGAHRVILAIISPEVGIGEEEAEDIATLLLRGNISLLVADETRASNTLLRKLGLEISGARLKGPLNAPYVPAVISVPEEGSFSVVLSVASSLEIVEGSIIQGLDYEAVSETPAGELVAVAGEAGKGRFFVLGDGTIFLNTALSGNASSLGDYRNLSLAIFRYLSGAADPSDVVVAYDLSHYNDSLKPLRGGNGVGSGPSRSLDGIIRSYSGLDLPILLHPAMFVLLGLYFLRLAESIFFEIASRELFVAPIAATVLGYVIYRRVKKSFGEALDDNVETRVPEIDMIAETIIRRQVEALAKIGKREALELTHNLYLILDAILSKHMATSLKEIHEDRRRLEHVAERLGLTVEELRDFTRTIIALNERYEGKRKFTPIVFRWDRKLRELLEASETILLKLGYTLMGKEKLRGVEYGLRGL